MVEGTGLESGAVGAVDVRDIKAQLAVALADSLGHLDGFVGGIVQELDLQLLPGPLHLDDVVHETLNDVHLVENSQLNRDVGQVVLVALGLGFVLLVLVVKQQHPEAMSSVNAQDR